MIRMETDRMTPTSCWEQAAVPDLVCWTALAPAYGNPNYSVGEDGKLSAPMLNGTRKQTLEFINKLCSEGVLPVDWYSIEWEQAKSYTLNDKIGMVVPGQQPVQEYVTFRATMHPKLQTGPFLPSMPFENGKGGAGGNPGVLLAIPKSNVEGDDGKLMRICHILDAMVYGRRSLFPDCTGRWTGCISGL